MSADAAPAEDAEDDPIATAETDEEVGVFVENILSAKYMTVDSDHTIERYCLLNG